MKIKIWSLGCVVFVVVVVRRRGWCDACFCYFGRGSAAFRLRALAAAKDRSQLIFPIQLVLHKSLNKAVCCVFTSYKKNLYTEFFSDFSRFWKRKVSLSYNFMDLWNFIVISRVQRISNIFLYCLFFMSSYMYVIRIRYVGYKLIRKFLRFYAIKKSKCYKGIALQKLYYCYAIFQVLNYK